MAVDKPLYTIEFNIPPNEWLTANHRQHWAGRAKRVKLLRARARITSELLHIPPVNEKVRIDAYITTRTRGRFDPNNAADTTKPLIDGLTDARVLQDDDHTHLEGPHHYRGKSDPTLPKGFHRVTFTITPTPPVENWEEQAACQGLDTDIFFQPTKNPQTQQAINICNQCPVLLECRTYVDTCENNTTHVWRIYGIYAGETPQQRANRRQRTRRNQRKNNQ